MSDRVFVIRYILGSCVNEVVQVCANLEAAMHYCVSWDEVEHDEPHKLHFTPEGTSWVVHHRDEFNVYRIEPFNVLRG